MAKRVECPICKGTGDHPQCNGTGKVGDAMFTIITAGLGAFEKFKCKGCNGTGKCKRCNGKGHIATG